MTSKQRGYPSRRKIPIRIAVVLVVVAFIGLWLWQSAREQQVFSEMPEPERRALYTRTMENLRTVCRRSDIPPLTDYCRGQAELVLRLPECDDACRKLAGQYGPKATR